MAGDDKPWDQSVLSPSPSAHRLELGERTVLFCARRQQLYELNATADLIWLGLVAGKPTADVVAELATQAGAEAAGLVRQATAGWLRSGLMAPQHVMETLADEPDAALTFELDELRLGVRLYGVDVDPLRSVFAQFASDRPASTCLSAVGTRGLIFLFDGDEPLGAFDERTWVPEVKARLTEGYAQTVQGGFLTHAALVSRGDQSVLLCGAPGAGKTTLAVALMGAGFEYQADDIVRFDQAGQVTGAPFSPALKPGAWPLLDGAVTGLDELPIYLRGDGQDVKYLPVSPPARKAVRPSAILLIQREAEGPPHVEPVDALDALTTLLGSAYSAKGRIEPAMLGTLAETVNGARAGRLVYADLPEAVSVVSGFLS